MLNVEERLGVIENAMYKTQVALAANLGIKTADPIPPPSPGLLKEISKKRQDHAYNLINLIKKMYDEEVMKNLDAPTKVSEIEGFNKQMLTKENRLKAVRLLLPGSFVTCPATANLSLEGLSLDEDFFQEEDLSPEEDFPPGNLSTMCISEELSSAITGMRVSAETNKLQDMEPEEFDNKFEAILKNALGNKDVSIGDAKFFRLALPIYVSSLANNLSSKFRGLSYLPEFYKEIEKVIDAFDNLNKQHSFIEIK